MFKNAICLLMFITSPLLAKDWKVFMGESQDGRIKDQQFIKNIENFKIKKVWEANIHTGYSSITLANDLAYTMGNKDEHDFVFCFDAKSGTTKWTYKYPNPLTANYYKGGPGSTPTLDGDNVYTISKEGQVYSLGAKSGKVNWSVDLQKKFGLEKPQWGFSGSPLIDGNSLFLNAGKHGLALDKRNGSLLWSSGKEAAGYASPVFFSDQGEKTLLIFANDSLYGVHPENGKALWDFKWKTKYKVNASIPRVIDDKIFISSAYNKGCALLQVQKKKVELLWQNKNMRNHFNISITHKGYLYGFDGKTGKGTLRCLELKSGEVVWSQDGMGTGSLLATDKQLVILSEDGELIISELGPRGFKEVFKQRILEGQCWTAPSVANGRLYARTAEGQLVCYQFNES